MLGPASSWCGRGPASRCRWWGLLLARSRQAPAAKALRGMLATTLIGPARGRTAAAEAPGARSNVCMAAPAADDDSGCGPRGRGGARVSLCRSCCSGYQEDSQLTQSAPSSLHPRRPQDQPIPSHTSALVGQSHPPHLAKRAINAHTERCGIHPTTHNRCLIGPPQRPCSRHSLPAARRYCVHAHDTR